MPVTELSELAAISHAVSKPRSSRRHSSPQPNHAQRFANGRGFSQLSPAFGEIASALDAVTQYRDTPSGKVRINTPNSTALLVFGPVMGPLLSKNPNSRTWRSLLPSCSSPLAHEVDERAQLARGVGAIRIVEMKRLVWRQKLVECRNDGA